MALKSGSASRSQWTAPPRETGRGRFAQALLGRERCQRTLTDDSVLSVIYRAIHAHDEASSVREPLLVLLVGGSWVPPT